MSIDPILAVDPVSDVDAAHARYERLVGRPADNLPMEDHLVDWRVTETGVGYRSAWTPTVPG
jgi:hypothetical protein